jgi:hypothetical protein
VRRGEARVGDLVAADGDLLLVLEASWSRLRLLTLDAPSAALTDAQVGGVEVWELKEDGWARVLELAEVVELS